METQEKIMKYLNYFMVEYGNDSEHYTSLHLRKSEGKYPSLSYSISDKEVWGTLAVITIGIKHNAELNKDVWVANIHISQYNYYRMDYNVGMLSPSEMIEIRDKMISQFEEKIKGLPKDPNKIEFCM